MELKRPKFAKNGLVRTVTHHVFELVSPNLHQMCILGLSRMLLKMVLIDLGLLGVKLVQISDKQAFRCDNSSRFHARITKFAPNVYLGSLLDPIENGVD